MIGLPWKILLIEDDEDDYIVVRSYLAEAQRDQFELTWANTYEAGLETIHVGAFDAVLVDYRLGGKNGLDLIREAVEAGCSFPFILMTGQGNYDLDVEAMRLGAADYIGKDEVNSTLLERTIRYAIERKRVHSERERLMNQLEAEHTRLSAIINNAPLAIVVTDAQGIVVLSNPAADALYGRPLPSDWQVGSSESPSGYYHPNGVPFALYDLPVTRSVLYGETLLNLEIVLRVPGVPRRSMLVSSTPLLDRSGKVTGAIAMIQDINQRKQTEEDLKRAKNELEERVRERTAELSSANAELRDEITERKRIEETNTRLLGDLEKTLEEEQVIRQRLILAEKHAALSRMMASVAHEINNPIQTIQNCLFLAGDYLPPNSPAHDFLNMSLSESKRIARLVDQLMQVYRPARSVESERIEVVQLVREIRQLLEAPLQHQKVCWKLGRILTNRYTIASADQIKQVFLNISLNAIEALQPGGGCLAVSMHLSRDHKEVGVKFKDDGPGILQEDKPKIFEPFFTTKGSGTGLGLAICYEIIKNHNGHIEVKSKAGQGAAFTVWLPLVD